MGDPSMRYNTEVWITYQIYDTTPYEDNQGIISQRVRNSKYPRGLGVGQVDLILSARPGMEVPWRDGQVVPPGLPLRIIGTPESEEKPPNAPQSAIGSRDG